MKILSIILLCIFSPLLAAPVVDSLPGFQTSPYFDEQVKVFTFNPEVKVTINAPSKTLLDASKRLKLIFFALPNGNTTEQTIGKVLQAGDDWHFDIQHIGAQTRFLRDAMKDVNIVTVYLETAQLSWPTWRGKYSNNSALILSLIDTVKKVFNRFPVDVVLSGHSGGGSMTFGFLNGVDSIPNDVERIAFLDSDYAYDDASSHGDKIARWLKASDKHFLHVLAYNDSIALYNGAPIVSPTGGTWYRSKLMITRLKQYFTFTEEFTADFQTYIALNGRVKFILKENPTRAILHTVQVEKNGFIQSISSGTAYEGVGYIYYGDRAYNKWVQQELPVPKTFALLSDGPDKLKLIVKPEAGVTGYAVHISADGLNFTSGVNVALNVPSFTGLKPDSLYFVSIRSITATGSSNYSEVLAAIPSASKPSTLIVNGFDRASTGNTYNFIRQHGKAFKDNGYSFASATNDAVTNGLVSLNDYFVVDYILGDESTVDEAFSVTEQESVKTYLRGGGRIFVSGSEVGWDLDAKGTVSDKDFYQQYLKTQYVADNPGGTAGVGIYHSVDPVAGKIFDGLPRVNFDDGTQGTISVKYPDVITGINGGVNCLVYAGAASNFAGVSYEGNFPGGTKPGKVVNLGFPFETAYPDSTRALFMKKVFTFFFAPVGVQKENEPVPASMELFQNYPNPFNSTTQIQFVNNAYQRITLKIYDLLGREVAIVVDDFFQPGSYTYTWNASQFSSGIYYCRINSPHFNSVKSLQFLK